jgi:hypothetical protein
MTLLNDEFPDATLDTIGKVLVLASGHGLKIAELKRLIRAQKIKKIKYSDELNIESLVCVVVSNALRQVHSPHRYSHDIYFVSGDNLASTMLHLRTDKTVATIELNAMKTKKLHNACLMKKELDIATNLFDSVEQQHKKIVELQKKYKKKITLSKLSKRVSSIVKDYAKVEIQHELAAIEEVMSPCW